MSNMSQLFDASRFPSNVKVRANGKATVMTLYGSENGSLRLFSLWEGAILSFNRIYTQVWPLAQNEAANILLLNFCRKGRCEVALEDGQFAFLSQGHMAVGTQQAQEEYRYPSGLYETPLTTNLTYYHSIPPNLPSIFIYSVLLRSMSSVQSTGSG